MIRMVTWRTGGHQTPLKGSWSCQSALSISTATSPGTRPVDFMYVVLADLIFLVPLSSFSKLFTESTAVFFQILTQTLHFFSLYLLFCYLCQHIIMQAHLFSASGVFILCRHITPFSYLCLHSSARLLWTMLLLSSGKMSFCFPKSDICEIQKKN